MSVLAAVGTDVFDSFITLNLVQGLQREREIVYNEAVKGFEVTLPLVFGEQKEEVTLAQTFAVVDGSGLLEREQILLGSGFLSRVGGFSVTKGAAKEVEGLHLVTGVEVDDE